MPDYQVKPASCEGCPWEKISLGYASGSGPSNARLAVIAESLGQNEAIQGVPLIGWAGKKLNSWLKSNGVSRDEVYCDNIVRCQPPPSTGTHKRADKLPKEIIAFCTERHLLPALGLVRPNATIALGDYSLNFLTGKKGISKWRSSVLMTQHGKVIPTFHPSWLMKGENAIVMEPFINYDIGKGVLESKTHEYLPPKEDFNISPTLEEIQAIGKLALAERSVAVDIETSGGTWWNTAPLCIGFYFKGADCAICVPFLGKGGIEIWSDDDRDKVVEAVWEILADERICKVFQNGNYDVKVLENVGFTVNNFGFDTMIAHHAIISEKGVPHDLAFIGSIYTPFPYYKDDVKGEDNFALLDEAVMRTYNCRDVAVTGYAHIELDKEIDEFGVRQTFEQDMKMLRPMRAMEMRGILINQNLLYDYRKQLDNQLADHERSLRTILGDEFNFRSPKQLRKLFFEDLKLTPVGMTKHKEPSVDFDTLMKLSEQVPSDLEPLFTELIEWKKDDKLRSTYFDEFILDPNGRVHTQYTLHVTPTGRLSSRNPNLQNIPDGRAKEIFVAQPGFKLLSRDYSQIELRIFANLVNDALLLDIFAKGDDPHAFNAAHLFSVPIAAVTEQQRDFAKTFIYGAILYGGTAATVRRQSISRAIRTRAGIVPSVKEIEQLQQSWLAKHPNVNRWQRAIEVEVLSTRKLREPLGRVRHFLGSRESIVRAAYNFPIQACAASVINGAIIRLFPLIKQPAGLELQIHDELILEIPESEVRYYANLMQEAMEEPIEINGQKIRFPTTAKVGNSWENLEKFS